MSESGPWDLFATAQPPAPEDAGPWTQFQPREPVTTGSVLRGMGETALRLTDPVVRSMARGATFNLADELAAAGAATVGSLTGQPGTWSERYGQRLAEERARDVAYDEQSPIASLTGQVTGGLMTPLGRMGLLATRGRSMGGAMLRGGGVGGGFGALAGFGQGEGGIGPRALNAAEGALVGGAIGAAIPPAFAVGSRLTGAIGRATGLANPAAPAERLFLRDLERDVVAPAELAQRARAAGEAPIGLVDIAGENVRQAGAAVARMPGQGQRMATEMIAARGGPAQAERLRATVREVVNAEDFGEVIGRTVQNRRETARDLYAKANARPMPDDPRLTQFMTDKDVQRGIFEGMESLRRDAVIRDVPFNPAQYNLTVRDDGTVVLGDGPIPTQLIDAAQRGLFQMEEAARNALGKATPKSREIGELRRALLARADELNPDFAAARAAYAGDSALLKAAENGRRLVSMKPEEFEMSAKELRNMSEGEREFFRIGTARGLMDRINASADNAEATRLRQMFGTEFMRERLKAIFDDPQDFDRFRRMMDQEISMAQTNRAVNPQGGSPTMPLTARREDLATPPRAPTMAGIIGREPGEGFDIGQIARAARFGGTDFAAQTAIQQAQRLGGASALETNAANYARMLFTTQPEERIRMAEALVARELREDAQSRLSASLARALMRGGGVGAGQAEIFPPMTVQGLSVQR